MRLEGKNPPYCKPHRLSKGAGWIYQKAIPRDLRELFGKANFELYFTAPGKREAGKIAAALALQDDARVRALRAVSPEQREVLLTYGGLAGLERAAPHLEQSFTGMSALANGRVDVDLKAVAAAINTNDPNGTPVTPGDVASAILEAQQYTRQQLAPRIQIVRSLTSIGKPRIIGRGLMDAFELWAKAKENRRSTRDYKASMERLARIIGDVDVPDVTVDHIADFRDQNEADKLGAATQVKHLDHVRAIFKIAVNERWINSNPAAGIQTRVGKRKAGTKARHPFSPVQLRLILDKAEETQFGGKKRHADALWALRVAIWAGARIGEVCQLRKEDVTVRTTPAR